MTGLGIFPTTQVSPIEPSKKSTSLPEDNFLGNLLTGRLDKIDWLNTLFNQKELPTDSEGNALMQLFKGGLFGSAVDDGKVKNKEHERNFH